MTQSRPPAAPMARGDTNANPASVTYRQLVIEDFRTHGSDPLSQGFWVLFWHRFGNWRMSFGSKWVRAPLTLVYRIMYKVGEWACGMSLPYNTPVGRRVRLDHFGGMILVARSIGSDVVLRQNTTIGIASTEDLNARPVIEDGVDIGAGAVIVGDIVIGAWSVVGANAVVTKSVPPHAVVGGVPARLIRMRSPEEVAAAKARKQCPPHP